MTIFIIGIILILIGISSLLGLYLFKFIFAVIVISIGIRLMTRGSKKRSWNLSKQTTSSEDFINEVLIFSPINKIIKSENLREGKVVMVFAGGQIDLREAKTSQKEINIEFVCIFGGVKIMIPKNWRVNTQGTAIFGGYDKKTDEVNADVVVNLRGSIIFGGIEITN